LHRFIRGAGWSRWVEVDDAPEREDCDELQIVAIERENGAPILLIVLRHPTRGYFVVAERDGGTLDRVYGVEPTDVTNARA